MTLRIVVDSRFDGIDAESIDTSDETALARWLGGVLDDGVKTVVVVGDDATLSALATAHLETLRGRSELLSFVPLRAGSLHTVSDEISASDGKPRVLRGVAKQIGSMQLHRIPTLRVVDSSLAGARLGFSFGMGALSDLFGRGASRVRRRDAVRQSFRMGEVIEADVFVDWEQAAERFGYLLASATEQSWARIAMGTGATVRMGNSPLGLVRGATKLGRLVERASGAAPRSFSRIHIDSDSDYVVDGLVVRGTRPRDVALMPGPQVRVLA